MEFKEVTLYGEPYLMAQSKKHYSLSNNNQTASSVLSPGDWLLIDKHFSLYAVSPEKARTYLKNIKEVNGKK